MNTRINHEHIQQIQLFYWARSRGVDEFPALKTLHAIPNGGHRLQSVAKKMKAEGVLPGVWDIFLPHPIRFLAAEKTLVWNSQKHVSSDSSTSKTFRYFQNHVSYAGFYIEMKSGKNKLTLEQSIFGKAAQENGYYLSVCHSWQEAKDALIMYLEAPKNLPKINIDKHSLRNWTAKIKNQQNQGFNR